ncbi:uncharacterized protein LOC102801450 [Saccoglossus kowalevskii]
MADRQQEPCTKRMKLDSFNCLLIDISKDITDDNLRQMKDACDTLSEEKRIGRRQLEKITRPYDLIKELQLRGDIDECNTSVLEYLLKATGLGTLVKKLQEHRPNQLTRNPPYLHLIRCLCNEISTRPTIDDFSQRITDLLL